MTLHFLLCDVAYMIKVATIYHEKCKNFQKWKRFGFKFPNSIMTLKLIHLMKILCKLRIILIISNIKLYKEYTREAD